MNNNHFKPFDSESPDWLSGGWIRNWKHYVSDDIKKIWNTFTETQKLLLAQNYQKIANEEEWD